MRKRKQRAAKKEEREREKLTEKTEAELAAESSSSNEGKKNINFGRREFTIQFFSLTFLLQTREAFVLSVDSPHFTIMISFAFLLLISSFSFSLSFWQENCRLQKLLRLQQLEVVRENSRQINSK